MDSEEFPNAPFQSASLISTEDNLGVEIENVLTAPLESEQLVPHSDLIPSIQETEATAGIPSSAIQAPEETSPEIKPPMEVSQVLESGEPSHSDRLYTAPADTETPPIRMPADTDVPPEGKSAVVDIPLAVKPDDTETPPIRMPADTGSPAERKPAEESHIPPSEGVTKRGHTTEKPHTTETSPTSPSYPPPARGHSLQSVSIFTYLLLPVFAVTLLILILYFVT